MKEEETYAKARGTLGIGPIYKETRKHFENIISDKNEARILAVKEMLGYFLDFNEEELQKLDIRETKEGKDNIIYFSAGCEPLLREIYRRKAESMNENITIRNYVPPQIYSRFKELNKICKDKRTMNTELKTQIRFGHKELEIYTKLKGAEEGYSKMDLHEFLEGKILPDFDHNIKWKSNENSNLKRTMRYGKDTAGLPSLHSNQENPAKGQVVSGKPAMIRQRSTGEDNSAKKPRIDSLSSSSDREDDEDEDTVMVDDSPARRNQ